MAIYTLTIDHTKVSANLYDFPVYVSLSDITGSPLTTAEANSIRVYQSDGATEVPREIVSSNEMHFRASILSSSTDTVFVIDIDGVRSDYAANTTYGANSVWTNNYSAVWHLNSLSGSVIDSTGNGNDGVNDGMWADTGKLGPGVASDGSTNYNRIEINPTQSSMSFSHSDDMTTTAWIKPVSWSGRSEIIGSRRADSFGIGINSNGTIEGQFDDVFPASTGTLTFGSWNYVSVVHNGDASSPTADFYINGAYDSSGSSMDANGWATQGYIYIGHESRGNSRLNGVVDEIRVARDSRSSAWISTEYSNQNSPSTFYSVAAQSSGTKIKVFNGTSFVMKPVKAWDGSEWADKPVKYWSGSEWVEPN